MGAFLPRTSVSKDRFMPAVTSGVQLRSLVKSSGQLELSLTRAPVPEPGEGEVLVRIDAAPINPSDLAVLLPGADLSAATAAVTDGFPMITAPIPPAFMRGLTARLDTALPVGNEGAGVVVAAGASPAAQALIGKTVSLLGGALYAQYRLANAADVLVLPEGATAADGASSFVNPMTALGFVETMRREGHQALVNTAAASNLGQMLVKLCQADGIDLVNIVRSEAQTKLLRDLGAKHVCDSSSDTFKDDLIRSLVETGATLAFDAIGGGKLVGQILSAMEIALNRRGGAYSPYGSTTHKQVYIYGGLDMSPTILGRSFGLHWGVGGWLVTSFLQKIGPEATVKMRRRVAENLTTTFASHYTQEISLAEALDLETLRKYGRTATGEKYLMVPSKGLTAASPAGTPG